MKKIVTVVGARPQFVKAAVISRLIRGEYTSEFSEILVHTGQHYDDNMSDVFFREMSIPEPDINLEIGSGSHGRMTGRMLEKIEEVLLREKPDCLLTYGDTNTTISGALAASKLHIPVAHVEAGLRSFDKRMPEEQNRVLTDHLSSFLFCPTDKAVENLHSEGLTRGIFRTGDIMFDASLFYRERLSLPDFDLPDEFMLITIHRAENTDDPLRMKNIVDALNESDALPGILPLHPRTRKTMDSMGLRFRDHIRVIEPVGFLQMLALEDACTCIVTDSGGVQKEAYFFQKPCITLRDQTEWVETVEAGWNRIVGADKEKITDALKTLSVPDTYNPLYGNGNTGKEILTILQQNGADNEHV